MIVDWASGMAVAIAGLYTVGTVGVTGGPNHGEHPLIVTIVHMVAFAYFGRTWPMHSRELYWGGLIVALALSVISLRMTHNENRSWRVPVRIGMAMIYGGLLFVLFSRH
jgi:hypothetical protein